MLRKIFTLVCLAAFVGSIAACSGGPSKEVKMGDPAKKSEHSEKAKADPDSTIGLGKPDE